MIYDRIEKRKMGLKIGGSFTDDDVESGKKRHHIPQNIGPAIELKSLLIKQWKLLSAVNEHICQEKTAYILKNKPVFDDEKQKLIKLDVFLDRNDKCGLVTRFGRRKEYDGAKLNTETSYDDWNIKAAIINENVIDLNMCIETGNRVSNVIQDFKEKRVDVDRLQAKFKPICQFFANPIFVGIIILFIYFLYIMAYLLDSCAREDSSQSSIN